MRKVLQGFTLLIAINLFAFLGVWYILDHVFESWAQYKIICLVLSVFSLAFFSTWYFKKALSEIEQIAPNENVEEE